MSGTLSLVSGIAGGDALAGPLGSVASGVLGLLRTAAWRGVTFEMLDSSHGAGRRWQKTLFPGRDDATHSDLGAEDGPITINALLIGDDYVRRARRLEAACKQPGPGTLLHPWLGELRVRLDGLARFKFEDAKIRVCTVEMAFERYPDPDAPPSADTLTELLDRVDGLLDEGRIMLAGALAPLGTALGLLGGVSSALGIVAGLWTGVLGRSGALAAAAALPLDALTGGVALLAGPGLPIQAAALLAAVPASVSDAADRAPDPAIGPGPQAAVPSPADPRVAAAALAAAVPLLQAPAGLPEPAPALALLARLQAAAEAVRATSRIPWDSRDEAAAARDHQDLVLHGLAADLGAAAARQPLVYAAAWRAARALRTAASRDLTARLGRLPPVRHLFTIQTMSAWAIANAVAGDVPAAIRPAMLDLVRRNRIRHPGCVPPGRLEVLLP